MKRDLTEFHDILKRKGAYRDTKIEIYDQKDNFADLEQLNLEEALLYACNFLMVDDAHVLAESVPYKILLFYAMETTCIESNVFHKEVHQTVLEMIKNGTLYEWIDSFNEEDYHQMLNDERMIKDKYNLE